VGGNREKAINAHVDFQLVLDEASGRALTCKDDELGPDRHLRLRHSGPVITIHVSAVNIRSLLVPYPISAIAVGVIPPTILPTVVRDERCKRLGVVITN